MSKLLTSLSQVTLPSREPYLVALSGGVDSVVLAHWVAQQTKAFTCVHVVHPRDPYAAEELAFVRAFCQQQGYPLQVVKVKDLPSGKKGVEGEWRQARMLALSQVQANRTLLLGHHADDLLETQLFRLFRGTGPLGFSPFSSNQIHRPFLSVAKRTLEEYARQHQLTWREDPSNSESVRHRNFIRNQLIPLIKKEFPAVLSSALALDEATADLRQVVADQDHVLEERMGGTGFEVSSLLTLSKPLQKHWLRFVLQKEGGLPPTQAQVLEVLKQLIASQKVKTHRFKVGPWDIKIWRGLVEVSGPSRIPSR